MQGHSMACPCSGTVLEEQLEAELKLPFVDAFTCQVLHTGNRHKVTGVGNSAGNRVEGGSISK